VIIEPKTVLSMEQLETLGLSHCEGKANISKVLQDKKISSIVLTDYNGVRHVFSRITDNSFVYDRTM
jgi:hypothetical protein